MEVLDGLAIPRRLLRNTLALSIAQTTRIVFNTTLSLLIAHLLGAEGLGKYAVLTAYLQIFQVLIVMGVPQLVIREIARHPHREERKHKLFQVMLVNQVLGAGAGCLILILLAHLLKHPPATVQALVVVSFSLFPFAISSAAEAVLQADEQMGVIALSQIVSRSILLVGSVVALITGKGIVALAGMLVIEQVVVALVEILAVSRTGVWHHFHADLGEAVRLSRAAAAFFAHSILATVFSKIDVLMLAQIAGEEAAGLYNAAYLIIQVVNFLSKSYTRAAYPVLARLFGEGVDRFKRFLRRSILLGLLITSYIAIEIIVIAAPIVNLLYGAEYMPSVLILQVEAPFVIIFLWNALLSSGLLVSDLQRRSVVVSGIKLGASLIYYPLLITWLGAVGAALATVLAGLTGAALNYYFLKKGICSLDLSNLVVKPLLIGLLVLGGLEMVPQIPWPGLLVVGALLYLSLLITFRVVSKEDARLIWRIVFP